MTRPLRRSFLPALLIAALLAPTFSLVLPSRAYAIPVEVTSDTSATSLESLLEEAGTHLETAFSAVKNAITAVASVTSAAKQTALVIEKYVLQPLAFVMSGNLLKSVTSAMMKFISGGNGLGKPLYIQNLRKYLQNVGDVEAYAFFNEFSRSSNSPFKDAISSSLRNKYLQQTSSSGFFEGNKCTLEDVSADIMAFLAGDWSQGGVATWFELTTKDQNNPYTFYYLAEEQLARRVETAQGTKTTEANWGQGFLSWCGTDMNTSTTTTSGDRFSCSGNPQCIPQPGDACTKNDGTQGVIQTPGSVLKAHLDKLLGAGVDKFLIKAGDMATQVNTIMGDISAVMRTVNLATSLFEQSGFLGFSGGTDAPSSDFRNSLSEDGYIGITIESVGATSEAQGVTSTSDFSTRVNQYEAAWITIGNSADAAAASLTELANSCSTQAGAAQSAQTTHVQPVQDQADAAAALVESDRNLLIQIESQAQSGDPAYATSLTQLATASPTETDVAVAEQEAIAKGMAKADPTGSLNVSGGTTADRMNLIKANADALRANPDTCPPPPPPDGEPPPPPPDSPSYPSYSEGGD